MKKLIKKTSIILICIIVCLSFSGCIPLYIDNTNMEQINEESYEVVGEPTMRFEYDEEYGEYLVYVEGLVKNLSESSAYVCITYVIFDTEGNTIATSSGYCDFLEAGGTWRFCASGYSPYEPASFKLVSLY